MHVKFIYKGCCFLPSKKHEQQKNYVINIINNDITKKKNLALKFWN
jgi:hypothetical protein